MYSQNYLSDVQYLSTENGLSNGYIHSITQDNQGFIWISTHYGLSRYDGHEFKNFTKADGLRTNKINYTFQDSDGFLWVVHFGEIDSLGVTRYYIDIINSETFEIKPFSTFFSNTTPFNPNDNISIIHYDKNNDIWIANQKGEVFHYDGKLHWTPVHPVTSDTSASPFFQSTNINQQDTTLINSFYAELQKNHIDHRYWWITGDGVPWTEDMHQPNKFYTYTNSGNIRTIQLPFKDNNINSCVVNIAENGFFWVWFNNDRTLYVFDTQGQLIKKIGDNLINQQIREIFFDHQGIAWLSTDNGVYLVKLKKSPFNLYLVSEHQAKDTRGIVVDSNGTVYASQWSVHKVNKTDQYIFSEGQCTGLLKEKQWLWISAYDNIVIRLDLETGKWQPMKPTEPFGQGNLFFKSPKTGRIWLGTIKGLVYLDTTQWIVQSFNKYNSFERLKTANIHAFYENAEGIWLATNAGIFLLNEDEGIVANYLPKFNILHLYEDQEGIFWLATHEEGLLKWNRRTNELQQFTTNDGLSSNTIYAVYEDDFGYLWLPSQKGLNRFCKKIQTVTNIYMPKDGLPHEEFNAYSHARAPDGQLFFGGQGGIIAFHPKDFMNDADYETPLVVTSFQKQNPADGLFKDFTSDYLHNQKLILGPREKSFVLRFALLDFKNINKNKYLYKIEDLDKTWSKLEDNSLRIGGLPYGNYTIHVKAQGSEGRWSSNELNIPLAIKRPFYLKWWFFIIFLTFAIITTRLVIKYRTYKLQQLNMQLEKEVSARTAIIQTQAEKLKELDEQKSNFFINMAHELRTPLTMMLSPVEHALNNDNLDEKIRKLLLSLRKNAQYLANITESILNMARMDVGQLDLQESEVPVANFIRHVFSMHESYAKLQNIDYQLYINIKNNLYLTIDQEKVAHILHNLLSNALKFTSSGGRVILEVMEQEYAIQIQVKDTGIGIAPEDVPRVFERYFQAKRAQYPLKGGTGIGLAMAAEYAKLMKGNLTVESKLDEGSVFTFLLPKKTMLHKIPETPLNTELFEHRQVVSRLENKGHQNTILVVEDNVELQTFIVELVAPYHRVLSASNGKQALKLMESSNIDCVITDIMMPEMDGFAFIEEVKQNSTWASIPIIAVTAKASDDTKLQALRFGINDYLYKPFSPAELLIRIDNLLSNYNNRKTSRKTIFESEEMTSANQQWLQELEANVLQLLKGNNNFKLPALAESMHISERHLRRKVQEITGLTANDYVKELRLQYAQKLLETQAYRSIAEVAYAAGFSSSKYFTQIFKARFGKMPSEYLHS